MRILVIKVAPEDYWDHLAKGRFVLGVGLSHRDTELEAIGSNRKQRSSRMAEFIEVKEALDRRGDRSRKQVLA